MTAWMKTMMMMTMMTMKTNKHFIRHLPVSTTKLLLGPKQDTGALCANNTGRLRAQHLERSHHRLVPHLGGVRVVSNRLGVGVGKLKKFGIKPHQLAALALVDPRAGLCAPRQVGVRQLLRALPAVPL